MQKIYTVLLAILLINTTATFANNKIDSIGIENNKGKTVILYSVEAKETYYSISKKYNVNYKDVMEFNDNQSLQIGITLKIPTQIPFKGANITLPVINNSVLIEYTIKANDNLNMLAEKYGTSVNEIKKINNLSATNIQIGQILKIPSSGAIVEEKITTPVATYSPQVKTVSIANQISITHTIKAKENLNLIAKMYDTTIEDIKTLNGLSSNNLQIGQILKIPSSGAIVEEKITTPVATYSPQVKTVSIANQISITHTIKAKENLNLIAKMYNTTIEDIKILNGLSSNNLQIGQILKIPSNAQSTEASTELKILAIEKKAQKSIVKTERFVDEGSVEHIVFSGETIYSIAKKYNTTTYQIQKANNLKSSTLKIGQKLMIKNLAPISVAASQDSGSNEPIESMITPNLKRAPSKYGISQIEEKGVAVWIEDPDLDPAKMLILHRTAPVGTVIKITNPMTSRSTFAKVIGKYTENETTKDVIIVMTKAVADAIGALDKRFACTLSYGAIENEQ